MSDDADRMVADMFLNRIYHFERRIEQNRDLIRGELRRRDEASATLSALAVSIEGDEADVAVLRDAANKLGIDLEAAKVSIAEAAVTELTR